MPGDLDCVLRRLFAGDRPPVVEAVLVAVARDHEPGLRQPRGEQGERLDQGVHALDLADHPQVHHERWRRRRAANLDRPPRRHRVRHHRDRHTAGEALAVALEDVPREARVHEHPVRAALDLGGQIDPEFRASTPAEWCARQLLGRDPLPVVLAHTFNQAPERVGRALAAGVVAEEAGQLRVVQENRAALLAQQLVDVLVETRVAHAVEHAIGSRAPRRGPELLRAHQADAGVERLGEATDGVGDDDLDVDSLSQRAREAHAVDGDARTVRRPRRDQREPGATSVPREPSRGAARGVAWACHRPIIVAARDGGVRAQRDGG